MAHQPSKTILCLEVRESRSFYVYILGLFLKFFLKMIVKFINRLTLKTLISQLNMKCLAV